MKILLPLFLGFLLVASCHCHDEPCQPGGLIIQLKGFSSAELDSVVLRKYNPADSFTKILESSLTGPVYDTSNGIPDTSLYTGLSGAYNWEVYFPAVNKIVRLYDIRYEQTTERVCGTIGDPAPRCMAAVTSYMQDGLYHNQQASSSSTPTAIIVK